MNQNRVFRLSRHRRRRWQALLFVGLLGAPLILGTLALTSPSLTASGLTPWTLAQASQVSASEAARIVQEHFGGRVLNVDTRVREGRPVYRVKILQDNGRIRSVLVDPQSGRILNR